MRFTEIYLNFASYEETDVVPCRRDRNLPDYQLRIQGLGVDKKPGARKSRNKNGYACLRSASE